MCNILRNRYLLLRSIYVSLSFEILPVLPCHRVDASASLVIWIDESLHDVQSPYMQLFTVTSYLISVSRRPIFFLYVLVVRLRTLPRWSLSCRAAYWLFDVNTCLLPFSSHRFIFSPFPTLTPGITSRHVPHQPSGQSSCFQRQNWIRQMKILIYLSFPFCNIPIRLIILLVSKFTARLIILVVSKFTAVPF